MKCLYVLSLSLLFSTLLVTVAKATHLRAGEITAVRDSLNPLMYCFTLTTYTDTDGDPANAAQETIFFFGDEKPGESGTKAIRITPLPGMLVSEKTRINRFVVCHTFSGNGTYMVSVGIDNRNKGTVNIGSVPDQTSFFVATTIFINSGLGYNRTPILRNPPIDQACTGQRFIHNPAAYDADGDSIAYRLNKPQEQVSGGQGQIIPGYQDPATGPRFAGGQTEKKDGAATFGINAITGDLVWDAPSVVGQYNIAFIVEEWRKGIKIGEIIRDMQIIVKSCENHRPELVIPNDTCVEAGYRFTNVLITATDPDHDRITLTSDTTSSGVYGPNFPHPLATFTLRVLPQPQPSPASGLFNWQTDCDHIRQQPYDVLFKAQDSPPPPGNGNKLADLKTWRITVVGPKPKNLKAVANPASKSVTLTWDPYACQKAGAKILIWRKVGCGYVPGPCERGLAASSGYVVVGSVGVSATTFTDTNNGQGLDRGVGYSYRISVEFAPPMGGASLASDEQCVDLPLQMPVITHVTVDKTNKAGATDGQITIKWFQPNALDKTLFPGPYTYQVFRANGINGNDYIPASPVLSTDLNQAGFYTVFTDDTLDTKNSIYRYQVAFYYLNQTVFLDTTNAASSVRLEPLSLPNAIQLSWRANVPWSNDNQNHYVYRESRSQAGVFNIIAEVPVQTPPSYLYTDDGLDRYPQDGTQTLTLSADSLYCYKVETLGSYGNARLPSPLRNFSQEICASPKDTTRPCPPLLSIDTLLCVDYTNNDLEPEICSGPYENKLTWSYPASDAQGKACKPAVKYNVYYTRYEGEAFALVGSVGEQGFTHSGLGSYAGCYYVTAVDKSGNESLASNTVCKDNCPYYELPNVLTPNGDGHNDLFKPFPCPQFVESVQFTVYNRWGRKVFESDRNILIDWDGRLMKDQDSQGNELSSGVYYYLAKVRFQRLRRQDELRTIKGWVQILR